MTSSLAGTVAHGARGGRGVSTSHFCRIFPGLSGTPRYSPELPASGSHNTNEFCISTNYKYNIQMYFVVLLTSEPFYTQH